MTAQPMTVQPTDDVAVALRGVRFSYGNGATWALDGVDLTVRAGERVCIVGPNGSGKSTLSRIVAGLAAPDAGTVTVLGDGGFADEEIIAWLHEADDTLQGGSAIASLREGNKTEVRRRAQERAM